MEEKRKAYLDIAKGILIVCVVLGHMPVNQNIHNFLYSFHVPCFFIVSGYLWNPHLEKEISGYLWEEIKKLYIPYLVFAGIYRGILDSLNLVSSILKGSVHLPLDDYLKSGGVILYGTIGFKDVNFGPAWFLLVLLLLRILFRFICQYSSKAQWLLTGILFGAGSALQKYMLPFSLIPVLMAAPFFLAGRELGKVQKRKKNKARKHSGVVAVILFGVMLLVNELVTEPAEMAGGVLGKPAAAVFIQSAIGIYLLFFISRSLEIHSGLLRGMFVLMGKNSLYIMGLHLTVFEILYVLCGFVQIYSDKMLLFCLVLGIGIPVLLADMLRKSKWRKKNG